MVKVAVESKDEEAEVEEVKGQKSVVLNC